MELLSSKILVFLFFLSVLNVMRHLWKIFVRLRENEVSSKYELSKWELIFLSISVSYILTTIFTGLGL